MSERRAKGCLVAAAVWVVILALLGAGYRYLVHPYLQGRLADQTGGPSQYRSEVVVAADTFSGYAILRSDAMKQQLKAAQIKLTVQDDHADYAVRAKALQDGTVQFAVFTIDSLLTSGVRLGDFPGTIVLVIDETKGGDAIVAYAEGVPALPELNRGDARIVLTPDSPSEFLARVVIAHFNLPNLPDDWAMPANGAGAVFNQLRAARPAERRAYVLWEPYVSKARAMPGVHVLLDSGKLRGLIVDVLVVQRQFLKDRPDVVRAIVEAYLRSAYAMAQSAGGSERLVLDDARASGGETLDEAQARQVVAGIQWKNTIENYGHFGVGGQAGLSHVEDMIGNIMEVLLKTHAIPSDPLGGRYHTLFYPQILADLHAAGFHPSKGLNLLPGVGGDVTDVEAVRGADAAAPLTDAQWAELQAVGELRVDAVTFSRGSANLTVQGERDLQELARRLQSFPRFYVRVLGHTRPEGDPAANLRLAGERAAAAAEYLRSQGLATARLRTEAAPAPAGGENQAVSFQVGQLPY